VLLSTALREMIMLVTRAFCSIMCSGWALCMLPLLYYGKNKDYMCTIEDLSPDDFWRVMQFSCIKFFGEVVSGGSRDTSTPHVVSETYEKF